MGIDSQGKKSLEKNTSRPKENKPGPVTQQVNRTADKVGKILKK